MQTPVYVAYTIHPSDTSKTYINAKSLSIVHAIDEAKTSGIGTRWVIRSVSSGRIVASARGPA